MFTRRRRFILLTGIVLLGAVVLVMRLWRTSSELLLNRATSVPHSNGIVQWWWVSDADMLVFRKWQSSDAILKNVETGTETPLPELSKALHATLQSEHGTMNAIVGISKGGKWLCWAPCPHDAADKGLQRICVAHLDGSGFHEWKPAQRFDIGDWTSGSRPEIVCWPHHDWRVYEYWPDSLLLFDPETGQSRKLPISGGSLDDRVFPGMASLPPKHLYTVRHSTEFQGMTYVKGSTVGIEGDTVKEFAVKFIVPGSANPLDVSPDEGYRAWVGRASYQPQFAAFLHRILPIFPAHKTSRIELRVSRHDGSQMRSLGYIPDHGGVVDEYLWIARWSPDGKRLSFMYKDTLYTIPVTQ